MHRCDGDNADDTSAHTVQTFEQPKEQNLLIDYCLSIVDGTATQCGQLAADEFCKRQKPFTHAIEFVKSHVKTKTWMYGDARVHDEKAQDSFYSITCST